MSGFQNASRVKLSGLLFIIFQYLKFSYTVNLLKGMRFVRFF